MPVTSFKFTPPRLSKKREIEETLLTIVSTKKSLVKAKTLAQGTLK